MINYSTNTASGWPDDDQSVQRSDIVRKLLSWWREARDFCSDNRVEMATDEDFVDGLQWTPDEIATMNARGQMPLVYNEIRLAILWIQGTEKRTRVDWSVLPREPDDSEGAQVKTQVLKYLGDVNRFPFERSVAFDEAVKAGVGWLEVGIHGDEQEPIYVGAETWRNIWLDPMSRKTDISDARYVFRSKIIDLDIAQAMFPDHAERLRWESTHFDRLPYQDSDIDAMSTLYSPPTHGAIAVGDMEYNRPVIRLVECWYRAIDRVDVLRGQAFGGQVFTPAVAAHRRAVEEGRSFVLSAQPKLTVRCAMLTMGGYLLYDQPSPYIHNRFPFVPLFAFRRAQDLQPYGIPRTARDPQIDLNKRRSKALFALSTNKVIADEGAVDDPELFEQEAARPDQVVWKKPNKEVQFLNNYALADAHVQLALQDSEFIRQTSGVTGENLGLDTNAISGKAILAKQNQGSVTTAGLFDNLRLATQLVGEILLSLVEQFYDQQKVVRLIGAKEAAKFIQINQPMPDGSTLNDIAARQADFKVSESDYTESYRRAMFESMVELLSRQPPEIAIKLLDLMFEFSDLPNKEEIVKRIREINGQSDPSDPNAQQQADARAQQQAALAQQQQQQESEKVSAETELKRSQAAKAQAEAEKIRAETQTTLLSALSPPQPAENSNPNDLGPPYYDGYYALPSATH